MIVLAFLIAFVVALIGVTIIDSFDMSERMFIAATLINAILSIAVAFWIVVNLR